MADSHLAFIFPGQGSQSTGMLAEFADQAVVKSTFEQASAALDLDLWALTQAEDATELNRTENTQPALLCASIALWRLWNERGGTTPGLLAGHSLGEYSALVAAQALAFEDAVQLVALRGRAMQAAVPVGEGAMAAVIGLDDETVERVCLETGGDAVLAPANFNSPGQVVIAGAADAVERATKSMKVAGARAVMPLAVSVPSHCELMQPAAELLQASLDALDIARPQIPVLHNVDCESRPSPDGIRQALIEQLFRPVQWTRTVQALAAHDITDLVECGPGKVLCGLAKRTDRSLNCHNVQSMTEFQTALAGVGTSDE